MQQNNPPTYMNHTCISGAQTHKTRLVGLFNVYEFTSRVPVGGSAVGASAEKNNMNLSQYTTLPDLIFNLKKFKNSNRFTEK